MQALPDSVRWYVTLLLITAALAPFARALAASLPDRGAFVAKPLALLATVWPLWFIASATPLPFGPLFLWLTVAAAGLAGWAWIARRGRIDRAWLVHLAVAELVTLIAFAGYLGLRGYTPQITGTEKPMDIAFLAASARAVAMPPTDPWMAGESINYYYLGYLLHGSVARMSDVPAPVGYNLALATTFAMTVAAAGGLGYGIARGRLGARAAIAAGALAAFFVAVAGNLRAPLELLRDPRGTWDVWWWHGPGWESSRVVVDSGSRFPETINEFPSFSFILGDLHPHVMALPFTLAALTLAVALLGRPGAVGRAWPARVWPVAVTGAVVGALYPMNSWDYPTYLAATVVALLIALGWRRETLLQAGVLVAASILAWAPFWVTFVPFAGDESAVPEELAGLPVLPRLLSTVAAYRGERTSAGEFFTIFGIAWLIAMVGLGTEIARALASERLRVSRPVWGVVIGVTVVALMLPAPVLILAGLPLALSLWLLQRRDPADLGRTTVASLFAAGFALLCLTELFYIQDVFDGRMNTLFKVYYQVWTLFGVAAAVVVARLWGGWRAAALARAALAAGVLVVVAAGMAYPVVSAKGWTEASGPREWAGLDGAAFIAELEPDDLAAIRWLSEHAREDDVILEAPGCSYEINGGVPTNRISAFTGVPAVIGWGNHQNQWRGGQPELRARIPFRQEEVATLFTNPADSARLDRYGVTLLYAGGFERNGAGDACEIAGPFPAVLEPGYPGPGWVEVFASGEARIFRRVT